MGDDRRSNIGGYPVGPGPSEGEVSGEERLPDRMRELRTRGLRDREPPPTDRDLDREAARDGAPESDERAEEPQHPAR